VYTTINGIDRTRNIEPDGLSLSMSLSDPNSTCDFTVDDSALAIVLKDLMSVIVWDENAPAINGIPTVPSMNFMQNAAFYPSLAGWTSGGTNGGLLTFFQTVYGNVKTVFSNSPVASGYLQQTTLLNYVQPSVSYMFSIYVIGQSPVNLQYFLQINWLDSSQILLSSVTMTPTSPPALQQRVSISGVAPANAAYAQVQFGARATSGTNSGTIIFGTAQFEPMWFAWNGVSYPTPDLDFFQVNTVQMPDGTYSRKCRIFAGYIENLVRSYVGRQRFYAVQCASLAKRAENLGPVAASYTQTQDTDIIAATLANPPFTGILTAGQQNQFAPSSTLIPGSVIDSVTYTDATFREELNGLCDTSGSQFLVDPYAYTWYFPPGFTAQITELSDTPDNVTTFAYHDFQIEDDATQIQNTITVEGSKQNAAAITDVFSGNGVKTVFDLTEPPHTITSVTVNGSNIRTGVDGVDKLGSVFKALISKQNQTITFQTAPSNVASNVLVTYTYEDPVFAEIISADAVSSQGNQTFWGLVKDSNLTSTTAAKNRGLAELTKNAFPRQILTLSALDIFMPPGSLILFTCQLEDMSRQPFTVQTVKANPQGGGVVKWDYTAGSYNPTLIDHIRNVSKAVKRSTTTANVPVIQSIDVAIFDTIHLNDSVTINYNGAPASGPYKYGSAKYGFSTYS
jgi:hypothetical protein